MKTPIPRFRVRLLPLVVVAAGLLLSVKIGGVWQSLEPGTASIAVATSAMAEEAAPVETPAEPVAPPTQIAKPGAQVLEELLRNPESLELSSLAPGEVDLLLGLAARNHDLDARARDLDTQEQALALAEERLNDKLQQLKELKAQIEALVVERDEEQEAQLASLVKIYENMKPKDAAPIFDQLEMEIVLDVIERMKEAKVAPILALMSPERAMSVTQELAMRREMPPPEG